MSEIAGQLSFPDPQGGERDDIDNLTSRELLELADKALGLSIAKKSAPQRRRANSRDLLPGRNKHAVPPPRNPEETMEEYIERLNANQAEAVAKDLVARAAGITVLHEFGHLTEEQADDRASRRWDSFVADYLLARRRADKPFQQILGGSYLEDE